MKNYNSKIAFAFVTVAAFGLMGCQPALTQSTSSDAALNGEAALVGQELDHMAGAQGAGMSVALIKTAAADTDSAAFTVSPSQYDSSCTCFIRTETWKGDGYARLRVDSITYLDSAGKPLRSRNFKKLGSISHVRHVTRTTGPHTFEIRFVTKATVTIGTDTIGVWNGAITGSYDGEALKSGAVTQVTRKFHNGHWGFALSGNVSLTRPMFTWSIEFLGAGKAQATRTNNKTGHVLIISIDRQYRESV